jgi:ankyrin repeat protein
MRIFLRIISLLLCFLSCKRELLGNDYALFDNTPVQKLAAAVKNDRLQEIEDLILNKRMPVNFQEPKFGKTLLMHTVRNKQYLACEQLLKLGANPNIHDHYTGSSAIMNAAFLDNDGKCDGPDFIKLLLYHGANADDIEEGPRPPGNSVRSTPLMIAASSRSNSIEKIELLLKSGALINYINEVGENALIVSVLQSNYKATLLLLKNGADFKIPLFYRDSVPIHLWTRLREEMYPLGSVEHRNKMSIVRFLEAQGVQYRSLAVPNYVMNEAKKLYPTTWQKYLSEY